MSERDASGAIRAGGLRLGGAGAWLRRVMPHAAVASAVVLVAWVFARDYEFARRGVAGFLFALGFALVYFTALYYAVRGLRWLLRRLLWRVRRRLIITYLFVGLTPIVLLLLLGALAGSVGLHQVMTRIAKTHLAAQENQAAASARSLADGLARLPAGADDAAVRRWLDERVGLLQATLPGARVAVWRSEVGRGGGEPAEAAEERPAQFASEPRGEELGGVGGDATPVGAPLPGWLRGREEWRGLSFVPPREGDESPFGSPSLRALVRGRAQDGRPVTLLLTVPVSRAFVGRLRENTGLSLHPFFLGADGTEVRIGKNRIGTSYASLGEPGAQRRDPDNPEGILLASGGRALRVDFRRDQFGEPNNTGASASSTSSLVILPAANWLDGRESLRVAFLSEFSARLAAQQLFEEGETGRLLQGAFTLAAFTFLILELLALLSAALMTRAVTGTVHRLYRATEYIKRGDFSHRVRVRSRDQLGELAEAFNEMSADIESLLEERVERERLEREVEIAADVQAQLFPREVPRLRSAEVVGECRAARGVAGDYYDYVEVAPGSVVVALGDVSGKGISAALVMSNLQASLRAQATILRERLKLAASGAVTTAAAAGGEATAAASAGDAAFDLPCGVTGLDTDCAVENMAASINDQLCRSTDSNRFATVFLALYDDATRRLRYTNAGHNAPLVVRASGAVERLDVGGTVLGAFDWARYEEASVSLQAGDLLLIFSDGLSEAQNAAGEEYGEERIAQLAADNRHLSADDLRAALFDEIDAWTDGRERDDDQTVVILVAKD